jgi:2-methylisocitrate lyase-like PEP mutase family enzyme
LARLHVPGTPLPLPNPWDAGSARLLAAGFEALATTSSGLAGWVAGSTVTYVQRGDRARRRDRRRD